MECSGKTPHVGSLVEQANRPALPGSRVTAAVVHLLSGLARQGAPALTHAKRLSDGGKVHVFFNGSNPALVGRIWVIENTRLKRGVPGMKKAAFITMACAASFAFASAAQAAITASDGR